MLLCRFWQIQVSEEDKMISSSKRLLVYNVARNYKELIFFFFIFLHVTFGPVASLRSHGCHHSSMTSVWQQACVHTVLSGFAYIQSGVCCLSNKVAWNLHSGLAFGALHSSSCPHVTLRVSNWIMSFCKFEFIQTRSTENSIKLVINVLKSQSDFCCPFL